MRGLESRCVLTRQAASLQLADPVPTFEGLGVRLRRKMVFHPALVEPLVVKRAELRRQAPEAPNERGLSSHGIGVVSKGRCLAERQTAFGLMIDISERVTRHQQVGKQN